MFFTLFACAGPAVDGYGTVAAAVQPVIGVGPAREAGAATFATITFAAHESHAVDLSGMSRQPRCAVRYSLPQGGLMGGGERWGLAPASTHDCKKPEDQTAAIEAARRWARGATFAAYGSGDVAAPRLETIHRLAQSRQGLVAEASAWDVAFDLPACIESRTDRYAGRQSGVSAARCASFVAPVREATEYRDRLAEAAGNARKKLANSPVRPAVEFAPAADGIAAVVGSATLQLPGDTADTASGVPVAYALHLFDGEVLTVYARSDSFDPLLGVYDRRSQRLVAFNDDWRGRSARIVHRATENADLIVVVTSTGGGPSGSFDLTTEVEGGNSISAERRAELEAFAAWGETASDADVADAWRASGSDGYGTACLDSAMSGDADAARALVGATAAEDCLGYLEILVKARKEAAASQSIAGSLIAGLKSAID